jgi:hypothetical protein
VGNTDHAGGYPGKAFPKRFSIRRLAETLIAVKVEAPAQENREGMRLAVALAACCLWSGRGARIDV